MAGPDWKSRTPFLLGTREGWDAFQIVRWHGIEELCRLFRYEIVVVRDASRGPADLDAMVDTPATMLITYDGGRRLVHSVVESIEEIDRSRQFFVYQLVLVPHLARAMYRQCCRVFDSKSLVDIVSSVLRNDAPASSGSAGLLAFGGFEPLEQDPDLDSYREPEAHFRCMVAGPNKDVIEDVTFRTRVTQYNESDFNFFSRLLETYDLVYHFEHGAKASVLTITDRPGDVSLVTWPRHVSLIGPGASRESVRTFRHARRKSARAVVVRHHAQHEPFRRIEARAALSLEGSEVHYAFEGPGQGQTPDTCRIEADRRLRRAELERALSHGEGTVLSLEPGRAFTLHDETGIRDDLDLMVVRSETYAQQRSSTSFAQALGAFGFEGKLDSAAEGTHVENQFTAAERGFKWS